MNDDGTVTYVTLNVNLTIQDFFFVALVSVSLLFICFIYMVFVIYMLVRFIRNQRRVMKLYYTDKETEGKNWYYFLAKAVKKMKKYRRKSVNAAMVHIRMEKYRSYCACYGDEEGRRLVSDFYDVIKENITGKEVFARHEMCDFGILLCYENEKQLIERVEYLMKSMALKRPDIKLYFKAGINILDKEVIDPSESYNRATIARRKLKDSTTEKVSMFTQEMKEELLWERKVENEMERALFNHEYIELELTESAFFDDKQTLINIVNKMKSYGFAVSMDDFGAGYSSLNSLKELPIDVVKLDAEFFRGRDEEGKGKIIVGEAISLAKKLNMRIVAEGIETREQVDFLADNECDLIQGYYFAKPMPIDEFEVKVEEDGEKADYLI